MPKETENYKFKKPLYSDNADVAVLNENFDEIEEKMKKKASMQSTDNKQKKKQ